MPHFITEIDGLDIHFIHVRSKHDNALPLIVTHGWSDSVVEQPKIVDPLVNPTAHGASASDAFHGVIPSMPGYGYSGQPATTGWDRAHIARAWTALMKRLGYKDFVAQGGDWGAIITEVMGAQAPPGLLGIHTNMPNVIPFDIDKAGFCGAPAPSGLSAEEKVHFIHVRSRDEDAMLLIVTHGWPGSPIEQLKIIDPLTNPTAHGGSAADAFHVVIPSMAGYGFSGKPTTPGWDSARMARAWVALMKRLGYSRFRGALR